MTGKTRRYMKKEEEWITSGREGGRDVCMHIEREGEGESVSMLKECCSPPQQLVYLLVYPVKPPADRQQSSPTPEQTLS